MNREEWLTKLTDLMIPMYEKVSAKVPAKIRLTCGWPSKKAFSQKNRVIGECWQAAASQDKTVEIFISPSIADSVKVAEILAHELVHACGAMGHRGAFRKIAVGIGLEGPMRATHAGKDLRDRLNALTQTLGEYPHAVLDKRQSPQKKDGTRLIKVWCPSCGYTVRISRKWIDAGLPVCPCQIEMEVA